jgi:hypothetical protein
VNVRTPEANPTMSLATLDLKKEPWPQSWKMMKTRTSSPPARTANASVSHHETSRVKYIRHQTAA